MVKSRRGDPASDSVSDAGPRQRLVSRAQFAEAAGRNEDERPAPARSLDE